MAFGRHIQFDVFPFSRRQNKMKSRPNPKPNVYNPMAIMSGSESGASSARLMMGQVQ